MDNKVRNYIIAALIIVGLIAVVIGLKKDRTPSSGSGLLDDSGTSYPVETKRVKINRPGFYAFTVHDRSFSNGINHHVYPLLIQVGEFSLRTDKMPIFEVRVRCSLNRKMPANTTIITFKTKKIAVAFDRYSYLRDITQKILPIILHIVAV